MKNEDTKGNFFKTLDNLCVKVLSVNNKSASLDAFVKYTLSKFYSHSICNYNFYYLCIYFVQKSVRMLLGNFHSLKTLVGQHN